MLLKTFLPPVYLISLKASSKNCHRFGRERRINAACFDKSKFKKNSHFVHKSVVFEENQMNIILILIKHCKIKKLFRFTTNMVNLKL